MQILSLTVALMALFIQTGHAVAAPEKLVERAPEPQISVAVSNIEASLSSIDSQLTSYGVTLTAFLPDSSVLSSLFSDFSANSYPSSYVSAALSSYSQFTATYTGTGENLHSLPTPTQVGTQSTTTATAAAGPTTTTKSGATLDLDASGKICIAVGLSLAALFVAL